MYYTEFLCNTSILWGSKKWASRHVPEKMGKHEKIWIHDISKKTSTFGIQLPSVKDMVNYMILDTKRMYVVALFGFFHFFKIGWENVLSRVPELFECSRHAWTDDVTSASNQKCILKTTSVLWRSWSVSFFLCWYTKVMSYLKTDVMVKIHFQRPIIWYLTHPNGLSR
jgi:hypothetical protein